MTQPALWVGGGNKADTALVLVAGVDEAGRGPLAGPVVAGAVILEPGAIPAGLRDSKMLSALQREKLFVEIKACARAWSVARASVREIDALNILNATMLAMQRAVAALPITPTQVLIDGNRCPHLNLPSQAVIGGDKLIVEISAASILAKVTRDADMVSLDIEFPGYGFARHKGYPTLAHRHALQALGACPHHRRSFAPVRAVLADRSSPSLLSGHRR